MTAAAHAPGGYGGVPQSVGQHFNRADKGNGIFRLTAKRVRLWLRKFDATQHPQGMTGVLPDRGARR